jgi:predicted CoA-substrate-specific enzyme activase
MYSLGIDIGYSAVKVALVNERNEVEYSRYVLHKGGIQERLLEVFNELAEKYDSTEIGCGAVTGNGSKFLTQGGDLRAVNEVAAVVKGIARSSERNIGSVIEIGGETAKYITNFTGNDHSRIKISMSSNCAAGTGSFLEEQVSRLNLKLEDYSAYASRAKTVPRIAGRCSVFAKTDIIHHQQEGVPVEDILLGLTYALVRNYKSAVMKNLPIIKPVLFIGGVANNQGIVRALQDVLILSDDDLIVPANFSCVGAIGAATIAREDGNIVDLGRTLTSLAHLQERFLESDEVKLPQLSSFGKDDGLNRHICPVASNVTESMECYLGVDVGSTSTNLVLMNRENEIVAYRYLKTRGNPVEAVKIGVQELRDEFGDRVAVVGAATTGSGRYMIGELIGADVVKDEITAQAKAAAIIDNNVDTVFEIGGQDSKYISLEKGIVTDFQMNKICAAGTGSFIEEQANKLNIPINDFGGIALEGKCPVDLGERCTVFMETCVADSLGRGAQKADIASGLCFSIVKNYLNRVVGQKKIGKRIFIQGGIAYNQGVVNAFRALAGEDKEIIVPPFFSVTGAWGAAILAKEEMGCDRSKFKGFELEFGGGCAAECEKCQERASNNVFSKEMEKFIFETYNGKIDSQKKTVGIPRALFTFGMFPMFNAFFQELGFNVLLSSPSNEDTIRLAQKYSLDETCYPVKLINGHVAELVEKKVDYIFFPDLYTVDHPGSKTRQNYGCAYMQLAFKVVNQAMNLEENGICLLAPTIAFSFGKEFMMNSFTGLGEKLGKNKEEAMKALQKGMQAFLAFQARIENYGKEAIKNLAPDKKAFVIMSKIYGIADPVLNMGIPEKLVSMGYQVLPFFAMPELDIFAEHPNMYWPFGQHILEPAYLIKQHPNLYAVLLTHHGCGPDSAVSHYFRELMGGKPYLHIEVDEHSSGVGVITRVEAFVNSLQGSATDKAAGFETYQKMIEHKAVNIQTGFREWRQKTIYLPNLWPYSDIGKEILLSKGINAGALPGTTAESLNEGRKFSITEEYFTLTALLGDVFTELRRNGGANTALLIPQTEGAEVDGQYNRVLRTKLDEEGFDNVGIVAPYVEDLLLQAEADVELLFLTLLAGDIVRLAPKQYRNDHLDKIFRVIRNRPLTLNDLKEVAKTVYEEMSVAGFGKKVFVIGEPLLLFNDFMGDYLLNIVEAKGHKIVFASLSEYMWFLWNDYANQSAKDNALIIKQRLDKFRSYIGIVAEILGEDSSFEKDLDSLVAVADRTIGYYAGANGRYREAKVLGNCSNADGIITVSSMYENTGIVLNILHKGLEQDDTKPVLNLTFDGNKSQNEETKIESFIYFL